MQDAVEVTTQHLNQFSVAGMVIADAPVPAPLGPHPRRVPAVCVHVTPFQVAFLAGTPSDDLPLSPFNPVVWWADRITDGVFAVGIVSTSSSRTAATSTRRRASGSATTA